MTISLRPNTLLSRLKPILTLQRFNYTLVEGGSQAQYHSDMDSDSDSVIQGQFDSSKWRKVDSRFLGINRFMIPLPSWTVLKVLQNSGFDAYLVGGCVRDLLLNRIPKDYDVITTAPLKKIKKQFKRSNIVGRRFPICQVYVKGSVIEVSSFETVAQHAIKKENVIQSRIPSGFNKKDLVRYRNCMDRDFTINSLFFDPFVNKIYDYANGMRDLRSLKLQSVIPAQLSFKEDCARILRGLRIAARLGLSFSKQTETAIRELAPSIISLAKARIMMELNYMLSYGAAEPSLGLLQRFNLLEILLPFHAAYLAKQATNQSSGHSVMLLRLFCHLDKVVTCDRPADVSLWVGLLAFHLALVIKRQDAFVVWTFASVLYHGDWKEGVKFAREHAQAPIHFVPEISEISDLTSDDLAERVSQLAFLVQHSVDALTETDRLYEIMDIFPDLACSGSVFVSKRLGTRVCELFGVLAHDAESFKSGRKSFEINYDLLGKGNLTETRFVLGKIIVDTLSREAVQVSTVIKEDRLQTYDSEHKGEMFGESCDLAPSDCDASSKIRKKDEKGRMSPSIAEQQVKAKKQKLIGSECKLSEQVISKKQRAVVNKNSGQLDKKGEILKDKQPPEVAKKHRKEVKNNSHRVSQVSTVIKEDRLQTYDSEHKGEMFGESCDLAPSDCDASSKIRKKDEKGRMSPSIAEQQVKAKKQKLIGSECKLSEQVISKKQRAVVNKNSEQLDKKGEIFKDKQPPEVAKKHRKEVKNNSHRVSQVEIITTQGSALEQENCQLLPLEVTKILQKVVENKMCEERDEKHLKVLEKENCHPSEEQHGTVKKMIKKGFRDKNKEHKQEITTEKDSRPLLSSLFK